MHQELIIEQDTIGYNSANNKFPQDHVYDCAYNIDTCV